MPVQNKLRAYVIAGIAAIVMASNANRAIAESFPTRQSTTHPSTQPATQPGPPLATAEVARQFKAMIVKGDRAALRGVIRTENPADADLVDPFADHYVAISQLWAAAEKRFPGGGANSVMMRVTPTEYDLGRSSLPDLRAEDGRPIVWIKRRPDGKAADFARRSIRQLTESYQEFTRRLNAGDFANPGEAAVTYTEQIYYPAWKTMMEAWRAAHP